VVLAKSAPRTVSSVERLRKASKFELDERVKLEPRRNPKRKLTVHPNA